MAERWLPASVSPPIPTAKIVGLALPIPSVSVFCSFNIKKGMKDKKNGYFCSIYTRVAIAVSPRVVASMVSLLKTGKSFNIIIHKNHEVS